MKKILLGLAAAALLSASAVNATEYGFDKAHSHIGFTVKHILGKVPGEFRDYDGTFSWDPAKPESSKVKVTIQAASIDTANDFRDKDLRSEKYFNVKKYPTLTFVSTKVEKGADESHFKVSGDLTIHGVTKPVVLDVEYLGSDSMPMGKDPKNTAKIAAFSATVKIDRRDYGIDMSMQLPSGNLMVGNDVNISLDITGMDSASLKKMAAMMGKMKKGKPANKK